MPNTPNTAQASASPAAGSAKRGSRFSAAVKYWMALLMPSSVLRSQ